MISRNSRLWDRQLEEGLPDCRVAEQNRDKNKIIRGRMAFDPVYCGCCSKPSNYMALDNTTFAFFLCDECAEKNVPQGAVEIATPQGVKDLSHG